MPSPKLFSIIVLTHNHLEVTKLCLECLFATDLTNAEIIVVDNHSEDGTWEYLHTLLDKIEVIYRCEENLGVGEGYNAGFQFVHTPYVVTLNNDMLIHDSEWLYKMFRQFSGRRIGQVGIEGTGCWLGRDGVGHPLPSPVLEPDYVETCCMMALTYAVKKVGPLFDPAYKFCYCEDSDLSLRLRQKGWEITHIPLNVEHIGSVTLGEGGYERARKYLLPNLKIFQHRWGKYLATRQF